jgi:hypothetical protein
MPKNLNKQILFYKFGSKIFIPDFPDVILQIFFHRHVQ